MTNTTSANSMRFGPAGIPIQCSNQTNLGAVECCARLELFAIELQFGMGVKLNGETAKKIKGQSEKFGVSISCHAPYYINLCSAEKKKIGISKKSIHDAAKIMQDAGGKIFVFHPGFYQKLAKEEAYKSAKKNLMGINESLIEKGIKKIKFGAETVGKKTAFGGLEEVLDLAQELEFIWPVIDFAHIHARGDHTLKTKGDYLKLFERIEKKIHGYTKDMHCHFSEINYSDKGERNHFNLGTNNTPPYKELMEVLNENGYSGTIICETPKLDIDALVMQKYYRKVGRA